MNFATYLIGFSSMVALSAFSHSAVANTVEDKSDGAIEIEEIMVTAERRSQSIQEIPASISAFGAATIRDTGVVDISMIAPRVPGFYMGSFGASRPQLYIRGIGTRQFDPGSESSVGVFVDESYLGRTGGVLGTLKDIERIEVLKGPQGTLYGRNVIGGVVNVITKGPTEELEAEAEAGIGNYGSYNLFGAVSGALSDKFLGRIAVWRSYSRGYMTNLTTGEHPQGLDNFGGRLRLQFNPTDNFQIDFIAEIARDTGDSFQGESIGSTTNPNGVLLGIGSLTALKSDDPFKQYYTTDTKYDRDVNSYTGKMQYDLDAGSIISISSYREMTYSDDRDFDNTSLNVLQQVSFEESKQFSQEIRFVSNPDGPLSFGSKVDWIIGGYYFDDKSFHSDTFISGPDNVISGGGSPVDQTGGDYKTKSYAVFGQVTVHFTDQLDFTLGGRYTKDTKSSVLYGTTTDAAPLVSAAFSVTNPDQDFTSTDPKAVLSYQINDDMNVYVSYSQGFKSGGYQYTPLKAIQASQVFGPESVKAYEVGFKSRLLDDMVTLNLAAYQTDYTGIQVSRVVELPDGSTPSLISNAGESRIKGAEIDLTIRPTNDFTFNFAYAYTDAKYLKYVVSDAKDFSNTRMVRAPKHSLNVSADYRVDVGNDMELTLRGDYSYLSKFYHEPGQGDIIYGSTIPFTEEDAYGLANVRLTLRRDNWRVSLWSNNLFDKLYRRTVLALPGQVINIYGQPRTFGLTVGWTM